MGKGSVGFIKILILIILFCIISLPPVSAVVTWSVPSTPGQNLGNAGDIITVKAITTEKSTKWANFTWFYPNGSVARNTGLVSAKDNINNSDSLNVSVGGLWSLNVSFHSASGRLIVGEYLATNFTIVGNVISLSALPLIVSVGENSTITANVTYLNGSPIVDDVVTFTTNLGTLSNGTVNGVTTLTATTDSSGIASVNLTSAISGTATVTGVEEDGASDSVDVGIDVNLISLTAYPDNILADGASNSTITANVTYGNGSPVVNNVVNFTTDLGTLSNATLSGVLSLTATTDSSGLTNVTLTSPTTEGTITVTGVEEDGGSNFVSVASVNMSFFSDGYFNISQIKFPKGQTVYASAVGLLSGEKYKFSWYYPNGTLVRETVWLTGSTSHTDFWTIPSNAPESSSYNVTVKERGGGDPIILYKLFTVTKAATITLDPAAPTQGEQTNATAITYTDPPIPANANFTWIYPNGTVAWSEINPVVVNQSTDEFTPSTSGTWMLNVTFLNTNGEEIDFNSTTFSVSIIDASAPIINSVSDTPDPVIQGNNISITANVTDDIDMSSVWVEINGTNYTMVDPESVGLTTIFFDGFETGNTDNQPPANNWSTYGGASNDWEASLSPPESYAGSWHVYASKTDAESALERNVSTQGNSSILFSFYYLTVAMETGDYLAADYYNGTGWVNVLAPNFTTTSYTLVNVSLGSDANNNSDFRIRFRCLNDAGSEFCRVDNVSVIGRNSPSWAADNWTLSYNTTSLSPGVYNYTVYGNDTSGKNATPMTGNFTVEVCSVAIGLSFPSLNWTVSSLPAVNLPADGNNGSGVTSYNVSVIATGCTADMYIMANGDLTSGPNLIGLANETYRYNTTNNTVPGAGFTSLDTDYAGNQIGSNLANGAYVYLKFFLSVPGGQVAGSYNNTVSVKGVKYGEPP